MDHRNNRKQQEFSPWGTGSPVLGEREKGKHMTIKRTPFRRLAAGLGALALTAMSMVAFASSASAAQPDDGVPPGNAPADSTGTLSIHKRAGSTTTNPNNGTVQSVDRPPLAGAAFTICKVDGIDLTTAAGWVAAQGKTPSNSTCQTGTTASATTGATGDISFPDLPIGLYLVKETASPAGVTPAADFLVSIPYPSKSGTAPNVTTTWLWNVHTYPKNIIEPGGSKTVADPDAHGLGSIVPWEITTRKLGSFGGGAPLTSYKLIDVLVNQLQYQATTSLEYTLPGGTAQPVNASYYTITPAAPAATAGGSVTVEFTAPGVTWINTLQAGTFFTWKLTTKVVGVGALENKSYENTGGDDVLTGTAQTNWGEAKLLKHEANNEGKTLAGAKFKVYDLPTAATVCPADKAALGTELTVLTNSPNVGDTATEFTSDASGVVLIPGLYVGKDNPSNPATRIYCVVETVAPAGYVLVDTPIQIVVSPGAVAQGQWSAKVPNPVSPGPELPLTGAEGTMLFTLAGLAIVAIAGGGFLVRRARMTH